MKLNEIDDVFIIRHLYVAVLCVEDSLTASWDSTGTILTSWSVPLEGNLST